MDLRLGFRDLEATDLSDLNWSGGPDHIRAVAAALEASYAGDVVLLVGFLPNDRLIAMGGVDFRTSDEAGNIWMLAVHERFQSGRCSKRSSIMVGRWPGCWSSTTTPEPARFTSDWAIPRQARRSTAGL